ncbi:MAG: recombinase family protein [Candidatus Zixiibacteriota bacterium]
MPAQRKLLKGYARRNDLSIAAEFTDIETAKVAGRREFGEMVSYLKSHADVRILLVEKTDRLYRNIKDWVRLDELNLDIHFVKENSVLSPDSKSSEKFFHGIRVLMAKNYCDNLSEEVKKGLAEKASQGKWPHRAPVGYLNNKVTHTIEPDTEKATLVRKLFEEYATGGRSLDQLTNIAKGSGLFSRNSQTINKAGIHRILTNPIYYGEFVWKGKKYAGNHQPVISRQLFEKVQSILHCGTSCKRGSRGFAFSGLVKCGICGCSMTAELKKGKYVYYHCTQYHGKCGNSYIREEELDHLFAEVIGRVKVAPSTVEDIKSALRESQRDRVTYQRDMVKALRKRQDHLSRLLDKAYEDKLCGRIPEDLWIRKSKKWQAELDETNLRLSACTSASANYYEMGTRILELANSAYGLYLKQTIDEKAGLLRELLSNSTFTRGTLCPTYIKPFGMLAEGARFQSKRG